MRRPDRKQNRLHELAKPVYPSFVLGSHVPRAILRVVEVMKEQHGFNNGFLTSPSERQVSLRIENPFSMRSETASSVHAVQTNGNACLLSPRVVRDLAASQFDPSHIIA